MSQLEIVGPGLPRPVACGVIPMSRVASSPCRVSLEASSRRTTLCMNPRQRVCNSRWYFDPPDDVEMIRAGNDVSTNLAAVSVVIATVLAQEVVGLVAEGAVPARRDDEETLHWRRPRSRLNVGNRNKCLVTKASYSGGKSYTADRLSTPCKTPM